MSSNRRSVLFERSKSNIQSNENEESNESSPVSQSGVFRRDGEEREVKRDLFHPEAMEFFVLQSILSRF